MQADGTTICVNCHKRVPAEAGICQICGHITEVRTLVRPKEATVSWGVCGDPIQGSSLYWHGLSPSVVLRFKPTPWELPEAVNQ